MVRNPNRFRTCFQRYKRLSARRRQGTGAARILIKMSNLHESSSMWLLSSSLRRLSLADPQLLRKSGFIRISCFPKERYARSRRYLQSRQLLYRKQRYSIPRPKRSVTQRQGKKVDSLEHHPALMNSAQAYQPTMPSFNASPLEGCPYLGGSPDLNELIDLEAVLSADEAMYAPHISEEPTSFMMEDDMLLFGEDFDEDTTVPLASGTSSTTSYGSSPSTSIHSTSTGGSMNTTYTSDSTDSQGTPINGEKSLLPTGSSTYQTLSGPSGEVYFKCLCGKVLCHRRNFKRHELTCRLKEHKRYVCDLCKKDFAREDIRDRHLNGDETRGSACEKRYSGSEVCVSVIFHSAIIHGLS